MVKKIINKKIPINKDKSKDGSYHKVMHFKKVKSCQILYSSQIKLYLKMLKKVKSLKFIYGQIHNKPLACYNFFIRAKKEKNIKEFNPIQIQYHTLKNML
jgi:hypothetical protein